MPKIVAARSAKHEKTALRLPGWWKTHFIIILGNRTDTLVKGRSPKLTSIAWFAPGQGFRTHPAFFENAKRCQTAPGQELQLPEFDTYFLIIVEVWENALVKGRSPKLNSISWFAHGQVFCVLLFFGGSFWLVFILYLLVELARSLETPLLFKVNSKTMILCFG